VGHQGPALLRGAPGRAQARDLVSRRGRSYSAVQPIAPCSGSAVRTEPYAASQAAAFAAATSSGVMVRAAPRTSGRARCGAIAEYASRCPALWKEPTGTPNRVRCRTWATVRSSSARPTPGACAAVAGRARVTAGGRGGAVVSSFTAGGEEGEPARRVGAGPDRPVPGAGRRPSADQGPASRHHHRQGHPPHPRGGRRDGPHPAGGGPGPGAGGRGSMTTGPVACSEAAGGPVGVSGEGPARPPSQVSHSSTVRHSPQRARTRPRTGIRMR